jgi:hypothetical protein
MPSPVQKLSILLDGSMDDRTTDELAAPVVQQGSSPNLVESLNTRLSVERGTCVRAPKFTSLGSTTAGTVCRGLLPAANGKSSLTVFNMGLGGSSRNTDVGRATYGVGPLRSPYAPSTGQSAYVPVQITNAGGVSGIPAHTPIASCYNATTGQVWFAYLATDPTAATAYPLYVVCQGVDGEAFATPFKITTLTSPVQKWIGLTAHGADGIRLWYINGANLVVRSLTISGTLVTSSAETTIYAPASTTAQDGFAVVSDGGATAYLVGNRAGTAADGQIRKITVTSYAQSTAQFVGAMSGGGRCAVRHTTLGGTQYVAAAFSSTTSNNVTVVLLNTSLATTWTSTTIGFDGASDLAVGFIESAMGNYVVSAASDITGSFALATNGMSTTVRSHNFSTGAVSASVFMPWMGLQDHGAQLVLSSSEQYPLLFLSRVFGDDAAHPLSADYVDDGSIEMYIVGSTANTTAVARFGCVRGTQAPARTIHYQTLMATNCVLSSTDVLFAYRKDQLGTRSIDTLDGVGRWVRMSFNAKQPPMAHDKDGVALVAAAVPVTWDGTEVTEMGGPFHAPKITFNSTTGSGDVLAAGTHSFRAVIQWTDAAGLVHRSRPSNVLTYISTASPTSKASVLVTQPDSMRNGLTQGTVEVLLYKTDVDDVTYHLQGNLPTSVSVSSWVFDNVTTTDTSMPQIYSGGTGGEEQLPQPPPPLWDIAIIGSRAWGIDAEVRSRLVYSKLRVAGVGFEWVPAFEINFPSGAGKLMAVREANGLVVVLTEYGVFQIDGTGPSNTVGDAGGFGPPVKVADIGCTNSASVISTPAGILWQVNDYFAAYAGGTVQIFPNVYVPETISGAVLLRNQDEVVFFTNADAIIRVYNYAKQRWSRWNAGTLSAPVTLSTNIPWDPDAALLYCQSTGTMYRIDADENHETANMAWTTDWLLLGGDFQDNVCLHEVVFNGYSDSAHGVTLELFVDYETTASTSDTWSSADITPIKNAQGRYSLRLEARKDRARAVRVRLTESAASDATRGGLRPGALTVYYSIEPGLMEEAFPQGARK